MKATEISVEFEVPVIVEACALVVVEVSVSM